MALDADKFANAALHLLNEVGLDGLSTRRLAAELNVQGPALYKHFRDKAQLLDHMATAMLKSAFADLDPNQHWTDWLREIAFASRKSLHCYRDGARLLITSSPNAPLRSQLVPILARPLVAAGFEETDARHALATMASFVMGWVLNEQNDATREMMAKELGTVEGAFEEGVEVVIAGIIARRAAHNPPE